MHRHVDHKDQNATFFAARPWKQRRKVSLRSEIATEGRFENFVDFTSIRSQTDQIFTNNQATSPQRTSKQNNCDYIDIKVSLIVLNHLNIFDRFQLAVPKTNSLQKPFRFFFLFACEERTTTW